jgi:hypothetical protein
MMIDFWTAAQAVGLVALLPVFLFGAYKAVRYGILWKTSPAVLSWGKKCYAVVFIGVVSLAVLGVLVAITYNILLST